MRVLQTCQVGGWVPNGKTIMVSVNPDEKMLPDGDSVYKHMLHDVIALHRGKVCEAFRKYRLSTEAKGYKIAYAAFIDDGSGTGGGELDHILILGPKKGRMLLDYKNVVRLFDQLPYGQILGGIRGIL